MNSKLVTNGTLETTFVSSNYTLIEKVGEGGFGQVYKAVQASTQKVVAIKFLSPSGAESTIKRQRSIARFNRECDLVRRLNHPNIVSLVDKGQQGDSLLYAVYEYIDGITLKDYLASQGPLPPPEAAEIMACVLDALAHAHEQGIIHRDIKPANIMLFDVGAKKHVKILDFGISTIKSEANHKEFQTLTLSHETLGTPKYSAPEQLRGEPSLPQTDIYVWGLVFMECLTGTATIKGSSAASVFYHQLSAANIPLGLLAGHHSAPFFRRILHKKPLERPGNTVELYRDFRRINFSDLVPPSPPPATSGNEQRPQESLTQENTVSSTYSRFTERRQVSVLCIIISQQRTSLVDSASENQDIAEMLLSDQNHQCVDIALRYGATHVGSVGDTNLFYFGYPTASDNDSRLCARAAFDIWNNLHNKREQLLERHNISLELKIGITTGTMRSIDGAIPEGRVTNNAMFLAREAKKNEIACSAQFKEVLSNQLLFEPKAESNHSSSPQYYLLKGERLSEAFGFLRNVKTYGEIFGRQQILDELLILDRPSCPYRLFHIHGEAGIGKSRLLLALKEETKNTNLFTLQCLPEYQTSALYPLLNLISTLYQLNEKLADQRLSHILSKLPLPSIERERCSAILWAWLQPYAMLSMQDEEEYQQLIAGISLKQQKALLFQSLAHLLCLIANDAESETGRISCLIVCEDLHWADPTTLDFIRYFVETPTYSANNPIWLSTSRSPLPVKPSRDDYLETTLSSLPDSHCRELIQHLFDNQPVSERVEQLFTLRSDGNPLFLEELVGYAQKNGLVEKINGLIDFVVSEPESHVPENLRESLQQKLDSLVFAKDTAQLAAAIGRTFSENLLLEASEKDASQLQTDLEELQRTNIIFKQRSVDGNKYQFKHALIRDAVYESATTQKTIHRQVAVAMEQGRPSNAYSPAIIGAQWSKTSSPDQAIPYYLKAGDQSATSSIVEDAIHYFEKALSLSQSESPDNTIHQQRLSARIGLGDNLVRLAQHDEARAHYLAAIKENINTGENKDGGESTTEEVLTGASLYVKYGKSLETHHLHEQALAAYELAEKLLEGCTVTGADWHMSWLSVQMAKLYVFYWRNKLEGMLDVIKAIEPHIDDFHDPLSKAQFYDAKLQFEFRQTRYDLSHQQVALANNAYLASLNTDNFPLQTHCLFSLGFTCLFSQQYPEAEKHLIDALEIANEKADATLKTRCLAYITVLYRLLGKTEETGEYLVQAVEYAEKSGMDDYVAIACANKAWLAYKKGDYQHCQALIDKSNQIWKALSKEFPFPLQWLGLLIELALLAGATGFSSPDAVSQRLFEVIETLLDSSQHALPASIVTSLKEATYREGDICKSSICNNDIHEKLSCRKSVVKALEHAKALGYL
ncbi:protein kinase domain-containing protein [Vibrio spartinae]|uniref:Serine/threonine-protein kinase PrkC n=1 Tax=Vibrio spartinae TaxID=1918945 RepID=A0ABX6QXE3_9VIBR|nr:protein kinase [Vibrio spartinae]QMV13921.1 Serine/threonine-protein kinase PrkC [Vibrio spartinae]